MKNANLNTAADSYIGKIKVRNNKNLECFLNVTKNSLGDGYENYLVKNDNGITIGEITLKVNKYNSYDKLQYDSNPSHVFIHGLFNYSNPTTPYYRNTEQYKDIGIGLCKLP